MANNLPGIPEELQIKILSLLDAVAIARCSMTCRSICDTIKNSSLLAYTVQLHLNGLKDPRFRLSASHADLLEHLLRYRQAWLSLEHGKPVTRHLLYDSRLEIQLVGPALAYTNREHNVQIISLTTSSDMEQCTSQKAMTGALVMAFAMDPTQDMIALLCDDETRPLPTDPRIICIHIRTMSTDISHPLAHNSFLTMTIYPNLPHGNQPGQCSLSIAHNILAFTYFDPVRRRRVMIWDWITSELILDSSVALDPLLPPISYASQFGLIDYMYCLVVSPVDSGSIRLYKFIRPSGVTTPALHLATLHLPPISTGISIIGIIVQAGPVMTQTTSHIPLVVDDADRLHLFGLIYREGAEGSPLYISTNVFVHQRVFMHYIARYADANAGLPLDIPWMEWGPQNTRIICPAYMTTASWSNRCVHGQRVVQFPRIIEGDPAGPLSVEVLDFSRAAVLAAQGILPRPPPSSPQSPPWVLEPSSIIRHPYFPSNVETHLPCVSWTRELTKQYSNFLVNEDCIIGVQNRFTSVVLDIFAVGVRPI